jgi:hypothetical protein
VRETTPDRWLIFRAPRLVCFGGAVVMAVVGIAVIVANPAGISTPNDDAYGPDAPLQPWVVVAAVAAFVCSACAGLLGVLALWQRHHPGVELIATCEAAFVPLTETEDA